MKHCLFSFLLSVLSVGIYAQQAMVSGQVFSSEDNEPVIGATITAKESPSVGTVTDIDGRFQLTTPAATKTLIISFVGMTPQEVAVKPNIRVYLQPDAQELGEVVITGMQRMDKRLFTGATTRLDADRVRMDGMPDISRALEGKAAGVSVQNVSGTFGAAPKIRIRGATSIYGNSKPLWVVDGVVMEDAIDISGDDLSSGNAETLIASAIAGLNADDIESIQILKDGSATSIYGARAMAGVVVVTTKKGEAGVSRLNYTGEFTYRMLPSYRNFNIANSQEQMGIYQEMAEKGWLEFARLARTPHYGVYGKMYDLINQHIQGDEYGLSNDPQSINAYLSEAELRNTDWFEQLFNRNLMQQHAVSITSGTEKAQFYLSLSAMNDPGWTKASSVERYTLNANGSYKINNRLTLSMQGAGAYRKQVAPGTINQETDVVSGEVKREFDINPYSYALNTSRALSPNTFYRRNYTDFNILHELENNYINLDVTDVRFQAHLNWKILKGWDVTALGAIKHQASNQQHHVKDHSNQANAYRAGVMEGGKEDATIRELNPYLYKDKDKPGGLPQTILPQGGIYTRTDYAMRGLDFRLSSTFNTSINNIHLLNLFGGMEAGSVRRNQTWFRGWGYEYDNGGNPFYDYKAFKQGQDENTEYYRDSSKNLRNLAWFLSATYSYKGRYIVNGTGRYEGSNKLGKARSARWLPTWNISAAWNAHEEDWFATHLLSHATLKTSYSLTADSGPAFATNSNSIYHGQTNWRPHSSVMESGIYLTETENSELTYEKKHEFNLGIDLGLFNDRIAMAADVYSRRNYDLIGQVYTTGLNGNIFQYANVASMKSRGIELSLTTRNIVRGPLKWTTGLVFSNATNRVTSLNSGSQVIDLITGNGFAREGYPVRGLFSIPFAGLNEEGLPTFYNENNERVIGDIFFQENKKLDYLVYEGPTDPTTTGSLGNTFSYKGFTLHVFMTYSLGNVLRLSPVFAAQYTDLSSMPREFKNRWVLAGDEKVTNIPVIAHVRQEQSVENLSYAYNAYNYSTARTAKGDFIRMKEISLAYNFPQRWIEAIKVNDLSVRLQATNLFLIYADKKLNGQDPEFFNSGGVAMPVPRQLTLTLKLGM